MKIKLLYFSLSAVLVLFLLLRNLRLVVCLELNSQKTTQTEFLEIHIKWVWVIQIIIKEGLRSQACFYPLDSSTCSTTFHSNEPAFAKVRTKVTLLDIPTMRNQLQMRKLFIHFNLAQLQINAKTFIYSSTLYHKWTISSHMSSI